MILHRQGRLALLIILLAGALAPSTADAQGLLGRARRAVQRGAEQAVEREAERRTDEAVTGAIDGALGSDPAAPGAGPADSATPDAAAAGPGAALVNYDFVPGDRVLFAATSRATGPATSPTGSASWVGTARWPSGRAAGSSG